jgi:hypothetical protein
MNVFRRGLSVIISMALIISSIMAAGSTAVFAKETPQSVYSDVPETHWAYTAITELTKQNVVTGMGSGKFGTTLKVRITGKTNAKNAGSDGQKYWKAGIVAVLVAPDASVDLDKELSH